MEEEESTRAVPREELLRAQDAHVVVGEDAAGEDATLAVGPGENEANSKHLAALAKTMMAEGDQAFPPPPGVFPAPPAASSPAARTMPSMGGPRPSWHEPQQPWGQGVPAGGHMAPMGQDRPTSNPQLGSNPQMPVSGPHGMGMPHGGHMHGAGPMSMPGQMGMPPHMHQAPIPYPGQQGGPMMQGGQNGVPWGGQAQAGKGIKLSNQILLLALVGVICLAIFITGIVLFVTTKF